MPSSQAVTNGCAQTLSRALTESESRLAAMQCANRQLQSLSAERRIAWALEHLPAAFVLSSSFGAQAAVMLHLLTRQRPRLPVVFIDTGYLFPETYRFVDELTERLALNLRVYRARASAAWQEARHGQRWEQGAQGIQAYNDENKVEPMARALKELGAQTWFSGLRRTQASTRAQLNALELAGDGWKVHPIIDWTDYQVYQYLSAHDLPYHPLWHQGYISIGDTHTTRSVYEVDSEEATRFFGLQRECGIHQLAMPGTEVTRS